MKPIRVSAQKEAFHLILNLARALRGFQDDSTFCENVTYTQFAILDFVVEAGGVLPLARLHPLLNVEKSTTTRLVAPLFKMELLKKKRSLEDRRAFDLLVTKQGMVIHATVWECIDGHLRKMLDGLPQDEMQDIMRSLAIFGGALEKCCK